MELHVDPGGFLEASGVRYRCTLGRSGIYTVKKEGDGATPSGTFSLRRVLYRADRLSIPPETFLPVAPIGEWDGWCDAPDHEDYNRQVSLPHPASCEHLWRQDSLYDVVVVIGHNDAPVVAGAGSAIFIHVAAGDFAPTEGCVALKKEDLLAILVRCNTDSVLIVAAS